MADLIAEWAGKERLFRLNFGAVMDLEEACGKEAIGSIFLKVSSGRFSATHLRETLRIALICGGENKVEAKRLIEAHFDLYPYLDNAALVGDILIALMTGVEEGTEVSGENGDPEPIRFSEVSQICRTFNLSPLDLRKMTYADFINMVAGFNASGPKKAEPPTEEEFEEILARYEPEALK
ncbi:gene transfer agent family protein [Roseovarius pacificus]|uniref:gene transfer agent family protein n=1 Tax=Roseovarius pacificus TaxID=337701 RepID=UPI002A187899|nr:gene transfer agent family protein [Roseovarius pacificus]